MRSMKELIEGLCEYPAETEFLEFKENFVDFEKEGQDFCALANSAALHGVRCAYKVWGVTDAFHEITGTSFSPRKKKKGNQYIEIWLRKMLSSNVHFEFIEGTVFDKHVVVAAIYPATHQIARFKNIAYIRTGSSTQKLDPGSRREAELWAKVSMLGFESQFAAEKLKSSDVFALLDVPLYYSRLSEPTPESNDAALHSLVVDKILSADPDGSYAISNLGAIVLARDLGSFSSSARKKLRVIQYKGNSRLSTLKDETFNPGYASSFEELYTYIGALIPSEEKIAGPTRIMKDTFPPLAIRELLANALVHQDFQQGGSAPMVEIFDSRIEITNPGRPLVDVARIVNDPPVSRNEMLAALMRRMRFCEEAGTGWDKIIASCEALHLPAPRIEVTDSGTRVVLYSFQPFKNLSLQEREDACYWHVCVRFAARDYASNQTLRERFDVKSSNAAQISRLLKLCVEDGRIKPLDPTTSPRYMRYIPAWA